MSRLTNKQVNKPNSKERNKAKMIKKKNETGVWDSKNEQAEGCKGLFLSNTGRNKG
jgi:hypothetical protein